MATLNETVRNLLAQAEKAGCDQLQIVRIEGKLEHPVSTRQIDAGASEDLHYIERVATACSEEVEDVSQKQHVTFYFRATKEGKQVLFDRTRVAGRAVPAAPAAIVPRAGDARGPLKTIDRGPRTADDVIVPELEDLSGGAMSTRDVAVLVSSLRQQMRHNEGLVGHLISLSAKIHEPSAKMIETLGTALGEVQKELIAQAKQTVEMVKQTRVMEAEARTAEHKAKAVDRATEQLMKFMPVALTRIMNRYGLKETPDGAAPASTTKNGAKRAAPAAPSYEQKIAAVVADLIRSIMEGDQLLKLTEVLTQAQSEMFAEIFSLWDAEQQRVEAEKKKTDEKPADAKPAAEPNGASS